ncbi:hypothetical protein Pdsh_06975 [Pyrodictium delaneyi]|nr:hypothetical protein Pdsh_06975 [Pyrodictium delaneyi]
MTTPPNPIEILYNVTGAQNPIYSDNTTPFREFVQSFNFTNTTGCQPPDSWLSWDVFGYIGCKVQEGAKSLWNWIKDKIEAVPIIGAVVKFLDVFGSYILQLIFNLGWLIFNIGAALIAALTSFVEIVVWAFATIKAWGVNIIPWIPWIVLTMILATFVDSANRAARERSLFPLLGFITMWLDFFERIYRMFEKLFKTVAEIVKLIVDIIKPV